MEFIKHIEWWNNLTLDNKIDIVLTYYNKHLLNKENKNTFINEWVKSDHKEDDILKFYNEVKDNM